MAVRNEERSLRATLESILQEREVDLEFIVVDDGSTDGTPQILEEFARRDARLRPMPQGPNGLTRSLIAGCSLARGRYIARQDGGDRSLAGRLAHQLAVLRKRPDVVLTACGTRTLGPEGEVLIEAHGGPNLQRDLLSDSVEAIRGPSHHGAVMFRRSAYTDVGGYREQFRVAQDLDLWRRMAETGRCEGTPEVLYEAQLRKGAISHLHRDEQLRATNAIISCAKARRDGGDETPILEELARGQVGAGAQTLLGRRLSDARFYYFVGSLLRERRHQRAMSYYVRALSRWPLFPRAWLGLLRTLRTPA